MGAPRWLVPLLLAGAIAATYSNGLRVPFVFDDWHTIESNPAIRSLGRIPGLLRRPRHDDDPAREQGSPSAAAGDHGGQLPALRARPVELSPGESPPALARDPARIPHRPRSPLAGRRGDAGRRRRGAHRGRPSAQHRARELRVGALGAPHRRVLPRRLRRRRPRPARALRRPGRMRHADEIDRRQPAAGRARASTSRSTFHRRRRRRAAALAAPGRADADLRGRRRVSLAAPAAVDHRDRAAAGRHAAHLLPDAVVGAPLLPASLRLAGRAGRGPARLSAGRARCPSRGPGAACSRWWRSAPVRGDSRVCASRSGSARSGW